MGQTLAIPTAETIATLISGERIAAAREMIASIGNAAPRSEEIVKWANALAEPIVSGVETRGSDHTRDFDWLRRNADQYRGQWVALLDGSLLAASTSLREVVDTVNGAGASSSVLLHRL